MQRNPLGLQDEEIKSEREHTQRHLIKNVGVETDEVWGALGR